MASTPAIPAATLVMVRERPGHPPELLMDERAEAMACAGGALVFPGGRIDDGDRRVAGADGCAAAVAAVRETLEETAIPVGLSPVPSAEACLELQNALMADEPFESLLERHGLELRLDALIPLARWVPKFHATRRFDTLFYLARAPGPDWLPNVVEGECSGAFWISAAEALKREQRGEARLIFPTRRNLERLAKHSSFEDMCADAGAHPIEPISPWVEEVEGENFITIPEGIGYPVTREKLEGLWRG
jgi:8-oxo-dGTP pyrophosphatase MutT (NUDIX family)